MNSRQMLILQKEINRLYEFYMDPVAAMSKRHPKAARKRRVRKKWRARFGSGAKKAFEYQILYGTSFISTVWKKEALVWHFPPMHGIFSTKNKENKL